MKPILSLTLLHIGLLMTFASLADDASDAVVEKRLITDFTSSDLDLGWFVLNDNVMGGRSDGIFQEDEGNLTFSGRTNTDGGGFSSIRTKPIQLDLADYAGIQLRAKGDGRRYTWRLTTSARWRGEPVSYWADFEANEDSWGVINIPFSSFVPRYRGYQLDGPELNYGEITGMGVMIYDKLDGPFELQIAEVLTYAARTPFTLSQFHWRHRVLVVSAPSSNDINLQMQQAEATNSLREFEDRDMVLVTLVDDELSTAANRKLTVEETSAIRNSLGISPATFSVKLVGKDGSLKLSRDTATLMSEIYALIDTMPMRRREIDD